MSYHHIWEGTTDHLSVAAGHCSLQFKGRKLIRKEENPLLNNPFGRKKKEKRYGAFFFSHSPEKKGKDVPPKRGAGWKEGGGGGKRGKRRGGKTQRLQDSRGAHYFPLPFIPFLTEEGRIFDTQLERRGEEGKGRGGNGKNSRQSISFSFPSSSILCKRNRITPYSKWQRHEGKKKKKRGGGEGKTAYR